MDPLQRAIPDPQIRVVVERALRRQVFRHRVPLAAGRQDVEEPIQHFAHVHFARAPAVLGRRDHRFNQGPLGVGQITRISHAAPTGGATMLGLPHATPPASRVPDNESQPIPQTQLLSGSALSSLPLAKAPHPSPARGEGKFIGARANYTLTHFPSLAEDFTATSMKAMPLTPSSTVGNITAGSSFFFDRAARIAAATSV